nr:hypothetical protein [Tanacetum cinerariifolium]
MSRNEGITPLFIPILKLRDQGEGMSYHGFVLAELEGLGRGYGGMGGRIGDVEVVLWCSWPRHTLGTKLASVVEFPRSSRLFHGLFLVLINMKSLAINLVAKKLHSSDP